MAVHSVNENVSLINNQIDCCEKIHEYLMKAEALVNVALSGGFFDCDQSIINSYLWILYDIIVQSKNLHETALDNLIKNSRQN